MFVRAPCVSGIAGSAGAQTARQQVERTITAVYGSEVAVLARWCARTCRGLGGLCHSAGSRSTDRAQCSTTEQNGEKLLTVVASDSASPWEELNDLPKARVASNHR